MSDKNNYIYKMYFQDANDFKSASALVDADNVDMSIEQLGFTEALKDAGEAIETIRFVDKNAIELTVYGYISEANIALLNSAKKLGSVFIEVEMQVLDERGWTHSTDYFHHSEVVSREDIPALLKTYSSYRAKRKVLTDIFDTNDLQALERELDRGLDPNEVFNGEPLLFMACDFPAGLKLLLDRNASPDIVNDNGYTLLLKISEHKSYHLLHIAKILVEKGAALDTETLESAMAFADTLAALMKEKGARCDLPKDGEEQELLDVQAHAYDWQTLKKLVARGDKFNEEDLHTLIESALECHDFNAARDLLEQLESIAPDTDFSEMYCSDFASDPDAYSYIQKLIPRIEGFSTLCPESSGLNNAVRGHCIDNARLLIDAGVLLDDIDEDGEYAFPILAGLLSWLTGPMAELLLDAGADPFLEFKDEGGEIEGCSAAEQVFKFRSNRDPEVVAVFNKAVDGLPLEEKDKFLSLS